MKYPESHAWNQHLDELNHHRPARQLTVSLVRIEGPVINFVHTRHVHPYWQLEWVVGDGLGIQIGRRQFTPKDGDLVLIPPQNWHHLTHPHGKQGRSFKFVVDEMTEKYPPGIVADSPAARLLHQALGAAVRLGNEPDEQVRVHLEHLLAAIIDIHYARADVDGAEYDLVRETRKHIERAVVAGRPLKVNELAAALRCSTAYLNRVLRHHLGIPAKVLIDQHRFETAGRLLLETNLSVSELADTLGFDDPFRFSRFFKRLGGLSPSDYRKGQPPPAE